MSEARGQNSEVLGFTIDMQRFAPHTQNQHRARKTPFALRLNENMVVDEFKDLESLKTLFISVPNLCLFLMKWYKFRKKKSYLINSSTELEQNTSYKIY